MTRIGWPGSGWCEYDIIVQKLFAYLQNHAGCPVWPQILNQAFGDQERVLGKSCRQYQGLSGSPFLVLIREVWAKLQQFEFRSMHGVHGGTDLHGECSNAHAS